MNEFGTIDCRFIKENLPKNVVSQIFFGYEIQLVVILIKLILTHLISFDLTS